MLAHVTVRRGFPLKAFFEVVPPEPDVGLKGGVEVYKLRTEKGGSVAFLRLTKDEWDDIARQCAESLCVEPW